MHELELLENVLAHRGREVTWTVPEDAVIIPGNREHLLDGAVITSWSVSE